MYKRLLSEKLKKSMFKGKVLIIKGARQTGKTTLALDLVKHSEYKNSCLIINCDNPTDRELLENRDIEYLKRIVGKEKIIFIDEGQKVTTIGQTLKLLVDYYKKSKQIIVTGSSSINLLDKTQEPLTGRKRVLDLYPLSFEEIFPKKSIAYILKELPSLLVYGCYPEVVLQKSFAEKIEALKELTSSYLYKDILEFQQIKNPHLLNSLLKALALQIGSEVSYSELSRTIGIDKKTVEHYIDLLEKNHIIFRLVPYTKNKRRELTKLKKIFFVDVGIRNALINNFNPLDSRDDTGALWENIIIMERLKYRSYHNILADQYFWRTYDGSEVDLVEEKGARLSGYEIKWNKNTKKIRKPAKWADYKNTSYTLITPNNFTDFIM